MKPVHVLSAIHDGSHNMRFETIKGGNALQISVTGIDGNDHWVEVAEDATWDDIGKAFARLRAAVTNE